MRFELRGPGRSGEAGKIDEKAVDVAVKRLLTARFALGEMDEPEKVSWTGIPFSVVASAGHDSLALDMARKSMTLLMNKDNTLPLKRGGLTVAVMGPNANDSVMQWGNYNGIPAHTGYLIGSCPCQTTGRTNHIRTGL